MKERLTKAEIGEHYSRPVTAEEDIWITYQEEVLRSSRRMPDTGCINISSIPMKPNSL